jgi:hypothetical protein
MLDYTYRAYGDRDLIYGYRINTASNPDLRAALLHMQQRRYVDTMQYLSSAVEDVETETRKRLLGEGWEELLTLKSKAEEGLVSDMAKECMKNLNQWENVI